MAYDSKRHDISILEGDKRIKLFMKIREEIKKTILESPIAKKLSPATKKYLSSSILSFAFDKAHIDAVAKSNKAKAIRIYQGATPPHGTPTLVIYACEVKFHNSSSVTNQTSSGGGSQHPYLQGTDQTRTKFSGVTDTSQTLNTDETGYE